MPEARPDPLLDLYREGEACETALLAYKRSLLEASPEQYKAFKADLPLHEAVIGLFYGASSQAELDGYMSKTPAELAEIAAQKYGGNDT